MSFKALSLVLTLWTITAQCAITPLSEVVDSNFAFARKFTNLVIEEHKDENVVCSPLSTHVILALTAHGAGGNTRKQFSDAICGSNDHCLDPEGLKQWISKIKGAENVTTNIASKIYTPRNSELNEDYQKVTEDAFQAEVNVTKGTLEEITDEINNWVSEKTNKKIKQLVEEGELTNDTSLILLNAIHFNANWKKPFNKKLTNNITFFGFKNTKTENRVPTMIHPKISLNNGFIDDLNANFVELPYENPDYKMIIIVPEGNKFIDRSQFEELGQKLKTFEYSKLQSYNETEIDILAIPKFKVESNIDLAPILKKLGMTEMFYDNADFSKITKYPTDQLKVDKVFQKAFIDVNENGSEAAAATKLSSGVKSASNIIRINKPFYFAIVSKEATLFEGRIISPEYK